jgi:hypothetical protein
VFENRVLKMFEPKRDDVTREWRKLHDEDLNDLYSTPNIFRVIKSRRMRWEGHVARMGRRGVYRVFFWWGNLRERDHLEGSDVEWMIILRWIFRKWDLEVWTESSWLWIGTRGEHL